MTKIKPQPGILDISPYVGGSSKVDGVENVVKLSSNENPFGPSEAAKEAFRKAGFDLHRYPSTGHERLREAIGEVHGLDADRVLDAAESEPERLDRTIADNEAALEAAGHWGVPTLVYKSEPFFGQDRLEMIEAAVTG